ncbi:DUF2516 family protein [Nocardioides massiliensis]|uniref:DUF2516 family protein n=1 Tax=Nocardioides massiliensis TaxID=1325935 RepID=A0ABT9NN36_9ACTN|nr:DUF2516 family protein [Nocardioides massiliensis]MDP9821839.1 hypothetical protein [Nocardioides massiliensis]
MEVFAVQNGITLVATLVLFGVKAWAFIDAVSHRAEAFPAADKLTKQAWLLITGIFLAAHMIMWSPLGLINIVGTVAAFVYLLDVRPALRQVTGRR